MKQNKQSSFRYSVKFKLCLILMLLTGFILLAIYIVQTVFLDEIYIRVKKGDLSDIANNLLTDDRIYDKTLVEELGGDKTVCVAAYLLNANDSLELLQNYQSKPNCNCLLHRLLITGNKYSNFRPALGNLSPNYNTVVQTVKNAINAGKTEVYIDSSNIEPQSVADETLTKLVIAPYGGNGYLALFLNTSVEPLESTMQTLESLMSFLVVLVIFAAIVFALMIALWITKPIEEINQSAKMLAKYNYNIRFNGTGYREIAELADTLNHAAEELQKVDNLQKELIANISHDLRTPLTLITGYAEAMRDLPDENSEENLQIIIDEGNRMKALVNDVLDISKIRAGTTAMNFDTVSLTNCIESELTRYNKLRDREGCTIDFRYKELVTVNGDYSRLMQVVYNLVNNAVNYMGEDKTVIVTQTVKDHTVRISVTDHGEGISEEQLPLIWDRYYKVDKTHKRATVGSGLGLSIVRSIVEAHSGRYGVESKPQKGSTFWFELEVQSVSPIDQEENA